jgi:hypothetical protein
MRRIFLLVAGILVRRRSLGVAVLARKLDIQVKYRYFIVKYWYFPLWYSHCFGHSSGRGARIKILREFSYAYGNLSAYSRLGVLRSQGMKS